MGFIFFLPWWTYGDYVEFNYIEDLHSSMKYKNTPFATSELIVFELYWIQNGLYSLLYTHHNSYVLASLATTSLGGWSGSGWGETRGALAPGRPRCNSILHLFGEWLFEAAFIGTELQGVKGATVEELAGGGSSSIGDYEGGRAEALGALCRIFCAKKTGEEILPVYLAR